MLIDLDTKNTLRWMLKCKSEKLYLRFFSLLVEYEKIHTQGDMVYQCDRGIKHCEFVENLLNCFLPNITKKDMTAYECFCLLSAVWFHDISPIFKKKPRLRENRYNYIVRTYQDWSLDEDVAYAIERICNGTTAELTKIEEEYQINDEILHLKFLAALLRISDWLDLGYWGIPRELLTPWKATEEEIASALLKDRFTYEVKVNSMYWMIDIDLTPNPDLIGTPLADKIYEKIKARVKKEFGMVKDIFAKYNLGYQDITIEMKDVDKIKQPLIPLDKDTDGKLPTTPYKFLDYYDVNDVEIFFGRRNDISRFIGHILTHRLVVIYGESGVGKTSLIKAGIIPRLNKNITSVYVRCDDKPYTTVKSAIIDTCKLNIENISEMSLLEILKHVDADTRIVFVDQFEEFFKRASKEAKEKFMNDLMECVYTTYIDIRFVISIRRDFFVELGIYREELPEIFSCAWELLKLSEIEARQAISGPAKLFNIGYDLELLDELVKDITEENNLIHPIHVQILCSRLIETLDETLLRDRLPQRISHQTYKNLGGAQGIISDYLDTSIEEFPPGKKEYARDILKIMTTSYEIKEQVTSEDILMNIKIAPEVLEEVLSALVDHRLLRRLRGDTYELTSDYLAKSITERWLTGKDVEVKTAMENIHAALDDWKQHRWLMNMLRFGKIYLYREDLTLEDDALELLLRSSIKCHFPCWYWAINLPRERVVSILVEIIHQADSQGLKDIVDILGNDSKRVIGALIYKLDDTDPSIREVAAELLGNIKDTKATDGLLSHLNDPDWRVAKAIGVALSKIADDKVLKIFLTRLNDHDWRVRKSAASALGMLKDTEALEPLLARLNDPETEVRRTVAIALGELKDMKAFKPLQRRLNDSDSDVREAAATALGNLGNPEAFDSLILRINDPDWRVREAVAISIGKIGDIKALDPLLEMLSDSDSDVRKAAATALGMLKIKKAIDPLLNKLNDPDWWVRESAANALSGFGEPKTLTPLLAGLNDPDWRVREAAANALGKIGDQNTVDALIKGLNDLDWRVRKASVDALGKLGSEKAVEPLLSRLKDSDSTVRESAAKALGILGNPNTIEHLLQGLDDSVEEVKTACLAALRCIDRKLYKRNPEEWEK